MGREAKAKADRRNDKLVRAELEKSGITERARNIFLGLKREDVQKAIKAKVNEDAPWHERPSFDAVAREVLNEFGYDLTDIILAVRMKPGRMAMDGNELVQLPPTYVFTADASAEAVQAACLAAGVKSFKGTAAQAPLLN